MIYKQICDDDDNVNAAAAKCEGKIKNYYTKFSPLSSS